MSNKNPVTKWTPGQEPVNPNGRPRSGETFKDIFNDLLSKKDLTLHYTQDGLEKVIEFNTNDGKTVKRFISLVHIMKALKGDTRSLEFISEKVEGKTLQTPLVEKKYDISKLDRAGLEALAELQRKMEIEE